MFLLILLLNLLVRGPDLWAATHVPSGAWFTGQNSWVDQIDLPLYFRVIHEGQIHGSLSLPNFADSLGADKAIIYPVYTLIGIAGRASRMSPALLFHTAGVMTSSMLVVVVSWFIGLFIKERRWRMFGLFWAFLAGGFGWIGYPSVIYPDLGVPIFNFWSALRSPHEAVSVMSLLLCLGAGYLLGTEFRWKQLALFAVGVFGILISHPQMIVPAALVTIGWNLIHRKSIMQILLTLGGVGLVYYVLMGKTLATSAMSIGLRNQGTYVFSPWYWLMGWGVTGLMACYFVWRQRHPFLLLWVLTTLGLFYFPGVPYQGMMIRGVWVAVTILCMKGVQLLAKRLRVKPLILGSILLIFSLGDITLMTHVRASTTHIPRSIFLTKGEGDLIGYLQRNGKEGEGVIGTYQLSNIVMGQTLLSPYVGHDPLTPHIETRYSEVKQFYQATETAEQARVWLAATRTRWVLMGVGEQQLAGRATLPYTFLTPVASSEGMILYETN